VEVQFLHQVGPMLFYGLDTDAEIFGDLLVTMALGNQFENLPLPTGDRLGT